MMVKSHIQAALKLWTPTPVILPPTWKRLVDEFASEAIASPRPYVLSVRYATQRVGTLLHSWGLPWQVVIAGYLWEYDEEQIRRAAATLDDVDEVLKHITEANLYFRYIKDESFLQLLNPPYRDVGALLIAVAIYFVVLETLQRQNNEQLYTGMLQTEIESVATTLLHIATRLGMWHLKHAVEDMSDELINPQKFAEEKREYERILEEDATKVEDFCQLLQHFYTNITEASIFVNKSYCSIRGMSRRAQDAHTTAFYQKTHLTGFDLITFDVIVPTVQECYAAQGVLSQLGQYQDRITDLIAHPKPNGCSHIAFGLLTKAYNSVLAISNLALMETPAPNCQIQIATPLMFAVAWYGCLYPDCYHLYNHMPLDETALSEKASWNSSKGKIFLAICQDLVADHTELNAMEPLVVYDTNRNHVMLPKKATALDFAYKLGKDIGEHASGVLINNRMSPLYRPLLAGDIVEIRTSEEIQVQDNWLQENWATTPEAHHYIDEALKRHMLSRRGRSLLIQELEHFHYILKPEILSEELHLLVAQYNLGSVEEYLEKLDTEVGHHYTSKWAALEIMHQITERNDSALLQLGKIVWVPRLDKPGPARKKTITEQRLCTFCHPEYPRDAKIMGRLRKQSGELVVHRASCPQLIDSSLRPNSTLVPMSWQPQPPATRVSFYVKANDRKDLILDITKELRVHQCELCLFNADAETTRQGEALILFSLETYSDKDVLDIWQELSDIKGILEVAINAATTPMNVNYRLQKQWEQRKAMKGETEVVTEWADTEIHSFSQQRNLILLNPFDISRPAETKMFFGRSTETELMQRELCDGEQGKALILYGPLRSGKSSICRYFLDRYIQQPFWGTLFSLQNVLNQPEKIILKQLAYKISEGLREQLRKPAPEWEHFSETDPQMQFRRVLEHCFAQNPQSRLVLVLDEFGGAFDSYLQHTLEYRFFTFWKELMSDFAQLSLILVMPMSAHTLLTSDKFVNLFSFAQHLPISFLDTISAQQLLADPLREQSIDIQAHTLALALKYTGGSPYYLTLLGQKLIQHLNQETYQLTVTDADLRFVIDQLVEKGSNQNFDFLSRELQNSNEFQILEKIVELTGHTEQSKVQLKKIAFALNMTPFMVRRYLDRMRIGLILDENGPPANPYYSFTIELVHRWLKRNHWFFSLSQPLNKRLGE